MWLLDIDDQVSVEVLDSPAHAVERLEALADQAVLVGVDTETEPWLRSAKWPNRAVTTQIAAAFDTDEGRKYACVVIDHRDGKVPLADVAPQLSKLASRAIAHNAPFDSKVLWLDDVDFDFAHDTQIMWRVLVLGTPGTRTFKTLQYLAYRYAGLTLTKEETRTSFRRDMPTLTHDQIVYGALDAYATLRVGEVLLDRLAEQDLMAPYRIQVDAQPALIRMMRNGIPFDRDGYEGLVMSSMDRMAQLESEIARLIGELQLFDDMQLPELSKVAFRKQLLNEHAADAVRKWNDGRLLGPDDSLQQEFVKLLVRYEEDPLATLIDEWVTHQSVVTKKPPETLDEFIANGRLHPELDLLGADSGRLASSKPNCQNLPQEVKLWIRPDRPDYVGIELDFSAQEMRVAADLAQAEGLLATFRAGGDVHADTAARMFGEENRFKMRHVAKAINFMILYGGGAAKLAESLTQGGNPTTVEEAKGYLKAYAKANPEIIALMDESDETIASLRANPPAIDFSASWWLWRIRRTTDKVESVLTTRLRRFPTDAEVVEEIRSSGQMPDGVEDAKLESAVAWARSFDSPFVLAEDRLGPVAWSCSTWSGLTRRFGASFDQLLYSAVTMLATQAQRDRRTRQVLVDAGHELGLPFDQMLAATEARNAKGSKWRDINGRRAKKLLEAIKKADDKSAHGAKARMVRFLCARYGTSSTSGLWLDALAEIIGSHRNNFRNTPIQGGAAEVTLKAIAAVDATVRDQFPDVEVFLTVHDSIIMQTPRESCVEVAKACKAAMEQAMQSCFPDVPAEVDFDIFDNWSYDGMWDEERLAAFVAEQPDGQLATAA